MRDSIKDLLLSLLFTAIHAGVGTVVGVTILTGIDVDLWIVIAWALIAIVQVVMIVWIWVRFFKENFSPKTIAKAIFPKGWQG